MTDIKEILKDKRYPSWMMGHPIWKEVNKINKIFPAIGLPNFQEEHIIDNVASANRAAKSLVRSILLKISGKSELMQGHLRMSNKIPEKRRAAYKSVIDVLNTVAAQINNDTITKDKDKLSLRLTKNIPDPNKDGKFIFRAGEGLFRVYNKLNELLVSKDISATAMKALDALPAFKRFSTENVPNRKFKLVFSSSGVDGIWDIATMSQRGIKSCQSWDGDYRWHLIGSMIDPFVGIIYLTSGESTKFGTKMMRRAIVRFVISGKDKKPLIIIDNLYPAGNAGDAAAFLKAIKNRLDDKFEVKLTSQISAANNKELYSPLNEVRDKLLNYNADGGNHIYDRLDTIASYQDFRVPDKKPTSVIGEHEYLYNKNIESKTVKFKNTLVSSFTTSIEGDKSVINKYAKSRKDKYSNTSYAFTNAVSNIAYELADKIIASVDKKNFTNSDTYIRRIYYNYFNLRNKIINEHKAKFTKEINGRCYATKDNRLQSKQFIEMMSSIFSKMDVAVKKELMTIVEKRKFTGPLPLP